MPRKKTRTPEILREQLRRASIKTMEKMKALRQEFADGKYIVGSYRHEKICPQCDRTFPLTVGKQVFCSGSCARIAEDRDPEAPSRARAGKAVASARARGANVVEIFDPVEVLNRDGWICWLCQNELDPEKHGLREYDSPEMDHVIPCELGGDHSRENCRCACRKCNRKKGNRLVETRSKKSADRTDRASRNGQQHAHEDASE